MKDDRLSHIRQHLYRYGHSPIQVIADAVGASLATVRRDLLALEAEGVIVKTHGGARIADAVGVELAFELREQRNITAKRSIGTSAFERITPRSTVFLDAGTTVLQVARRLRIDPMPLSVFTNCLTVAQLLIDVRDLRITLIGGYLRPENASMVGSLAEEALERLRFDYLFLGAGAVADDCCIYSLDEQEARLNEKMLARSTHKTLLIDSSKFSRHLTYRVASLTEDIQIITDDGLDKTWVTRLREKGCDTTIVQTASGKPEGTDE